MVCSWVVLLVFGGCLVIGFGYTLFLFSLIDRRVGSWYCRCSKVVEPRTRLIIPWELIASLLLCGWFIRPAKCSGLDAFASICPRRSVLSLVVFEGNLLDIPYFLRVYFSGT